MDKLALKKIIKEILLFTISIFIISIVINYFRAPKVDNSILSQIKGVDINGKKIEINKNSFPLIIHFWGSWCPVCTQEISNIDTVAKKYNLISIAVDSGDDEKIKHWLKDRGVNFTVINDRDGKIASRAGVKIFPTTLIFDKSGELKFSEVGYTTTVGLISRIKLAE